MKPSMLVNAVEAAIACDIVPILWGPPGIGKSALIKAIADKCGYDLLIGHPAVDEPTDWKGLPMPTADSKSAQFLPYGNLLAMLDGSVKKPTLFFFDDLGQSPQSVQAALMQVIHGREINGKKISDKIRFVCASNRETDRAYVQRLITPIAGRCIHLDYEVDIDDWCAWALPVLPVETVAFIRFSPESLLVFDPASKEKAQAQPRTWEFAGRLTAHGLPQAIEYEMYKGTVGEAQAAKYCAFLKIFRELPNPDAVIMNPQGADVPKSLDVIYALCGALARKATDNNIGRILQYADRLPVEYGATLVGDIIARNKKLANTKAYIDWMVKHQDVML